MKRLSSIIGSLLLLAVTISCGHDSTLTLSPTGPEILLARDKKVMESLVECATTGKCDGIVPTMLVPTGKVFFVKPGTTVVAKVTFSPFSSSIKRVTVLDGEYRGSEGWIYDRVLLSDSLSASFNQVFARLHHDR